MVLCIMLTEANGKVIGKEISELGKVIILTRMGSNLKRDIAD
jgi:hypothetical protein